MNKTLLAPDTAKCERRQYSGRWSVVAPSDYSDS